MEHNSISCANLLRKLFSGSFFEDKIIDFLATTLDDQAGSSEIDFKLLLTISDDFFSVISEKNFLMIESEAHKIDSPFPLKCVRFPKLISELSDGGSMRAKNKKALGLFVKNSLSTFGLYTDKKWEKVLIETKTFDHKKRVSYDDTIKITWYTRNDLVYLIVLTLKYLLLNQKDIIRNN
ncbi:hypothetical protein [Acanthamoeba castellanii mimivirus]|uniref:Uncharacterized protein R131 n=5 Tax=Mimivirus TaxID=315393 RepID=YR131_MIMIV|nr:hypothetical protein MIMI_gp0149 [Acanthamoeba polyphaga mimivirus]Q5UPK4.1 RecName: Full=Uncharacterized protein R131 [Acanthamoeba polyphaga mimivirus]AHA45743.1 hypothetical protein HIRU_S837 [Hirudovirus strain Sangsue]AHJ39917.2 hypothetical protein [Samba virus]ALR83642.1 hypothetical protein [Niemeyer virus]AMZ02579.1 hypothetical protein [Mimivirus Bombay]QTF49034.1 hypothetical protein [Mimivirus reunion]WMV61477.1 hypothetical protein qu_139 [Mimivirus sp.]BAV61217.1 hypothetic